MRSLKRHALLWFSVFLWIISFSCKALAPVSAPMSTETPRSTGTPLPIATGTPVPTNTLRPSPTLRPTRTPNMTATQRFETYAAEAQKYYDLGYISTADGKFVEYDDFSEEWAQMGWYNWWILGEEAENFYLSAHVKWSSAYQNAVNSGCGFAFAIQRNTDHYAVFLDRSRVIFLVSNSKGTREVELTRGNPNVRFGNPAEADFVLFVKGRYAFVLVDGLPKGEYLLLPSQQVRGKLGLTLLSGTNRDYGTRCEMTNLHAFFPSE